MRLDKFFKREVLIMSICVIMFTLVTKIEAIQKKYPGGLDHYLKSPYIWHDDHIVGSSFMDLQSVIRNVKYFERLGLCTKGANADCVLVTEGQGLANPCEWLEVGVIGEDYACWLKGENTGAIVFPKEMLEQDDEFKNIRIFVPIDS